MAKRKQTYEVISGCIQEGRQVFAAGQLYTPPTAELEAELLASGIIAPARPAAAKTVAQTEADPLPPPADNPPPLLPSPPAVGTGGPPSED